MRLGWLDELIDGVLSGESTDTTSLDVLRGVEEAIVLFGEERYEPIRARVLDYPDALRRSMVEDPVSTASARESWSRQAEPSDGA